MLIFETRAEMLNAILPEHEPFVIKSENGIYVRTAAGIMGTDIETVDGKTSVSLTAQPVGCSDIIDMAYIRQSDTVETNSKDIKTAIISYEQEDYSIFLHRTEIEEMENFPPQPNYTETEIDDSSIVATFSGKDTAGNSLAVRWVNLNECHNISEKIKINILRFDILSNNEMIASSCTNMPANADKSILKKALEYIFYAIFEIGVEHINNNIISTLSFISDTDFETTITDNS